MITTNQRISGGLWGSLCGDALGEPVEFQNGASVQDNPVVGTQGYGAHHQPPGTWSANSSVLLCNGGAARVHRNLRITIFPKS